MNPDKITIQPHWADKPVLRDLLWFVVLPYRFKCHVLRKHLKQIQGQAKLCEDIRTMSVIELRSNKLLEVDDYKLLRSCKTFDLLISTIYNRECSRFDSMVEMIDDYNIKVSANHLALFLQNCNPRLNDDVSKPVLKVETEK